MGAGGIVCAVLSRFVWVLCVVVSSPPTWLHQPLPAQLVPEEVDGVGAVAGHGDAVHLDVRAAWVYVCVCFS